LRSISLTKVSVMVPGEAATESWRYFGYHQFPDDVYLPA
jgi:hypothetical protein